MSELKPILETHDQVESVISGLRHLSNDMLTKLLLAHYTVDLDMLGEVLHAPCFDDSQPSFEETFVHSVLEPITGRTAAA